MNSKPVIALACLAAVFVIVSAVFVGLYDVKRVEGDRTASARVEKERENSAVGKQEVDAGQELKRNREREKTLQQQHDMLERCVSATKGYLALPVDDETFPQRRAHFNTMYDICPLT